MIESKRQGQIALHLYKLLLWAGLSCWLRALDLGRCVTFAVQGRTELEEQQAGLEALWQAKLDAAVTAALERLQQAHTAQLLERVAYLGALHSGKLGSMRDARLLERQQLQAELAELQERHLQQLQRGETATQLREQSLIEMHAAELQQLVKEHVEAVSRAAADAEQHLQEVLTEV